MNAVDQLEKALETININLTPEDRNRYGRVNEQNKLFINKVKNFAVSHPNMRSLDVDYNEFLEDFQSREFLEGIINRLNSLTVRMTNAKTLHDYDNYQDALTDYGYTSFRAGAAGTGFEVKHKELKQFFKKGTKIDLEADNNIGIEPPEKD